MYRVLRIAFLVLVTVGALAAVFGFIAMVGVARLASSTPAVQTTAAAPAASPEPAPGSPDPVAAAAPAAKPVVAAAVIVPQATRIVLTAADAHLHGSLIRRDGETHDIIGWTQANDWLEWPIETSPGASHDYHVDMTYACAPGGGGDFSVIVADERLLGHGNPTGSWTDFRTVRVGTIQIAGGTSELSVTPVAGKLKHAFIRLRKVELVPAAPGDEPAAVAAADPPAPDRPETKPPVVVKPARTPVVLNAEEAILRGDGIHVEQINGSQDIGFWTQVDQTAEWAIPKGNRGKFEVQVNYAADATEGGGDFELKVGDQKLAGHAEPTGGWHDYRNLNVGTVSLRPKANIPMVIKPTRIDAGKSLMNIRRVELTPVE